MVLNFYIIKEYFKYVIGTLVLSVFLFILFDFIHKTTRYIPEYEPEAIELIKYYYYQLPSQIIQAMPIASLLASVTAMVLFARSNELTALRAIGLGPARIAMPLLIASFSLTLGTIFISEILLPEFAYKMHFIKEVVIEGERALDIASGAKWLRTDQVMINFGSYDPSQQSLSNVKLIKLDDQFRPRQLILAKTATYRRDAKDWLLEDLRTVNFNASGTLTSNFESQPEVFDLPIIPTELQKERRKPNELASWELRHAISRARASGQASIEYEIDYYLKLAYPFAAMAVVLVGLQFVYFSERTTDTVKGVLTAFSIGIIYWFVLIAARALATRGDLPPGLAAWSGNVAVVSVSLMFLWRKRQG